MNLQLVWRSPALRAATLFALSGVGSTLGNLGLAKALPPPEYARVVLIMALAMVGLELARSVGTVINRYPIIPDQWFLKRIGLLAFVIGAIITGSERPIYGLPGDLAIVLFIICGGATFNVIAASIYQSRQQFKKSLWISEIHNAMLLVAAAVTLAFDLQTAFAACLILSAAYVIVPTVAWQRMLHAEPDPNASSSRNLPWREGFSIASVGIALTLLAVVERLSIPRLLGVEELATFAVLSAVASSPFRMLARGVGYTMLPRLRAAQSRQERRHLLVSEAAITCLATVVCCIVVWIIAPLLVSWLLDGKYVISTPLIVAALFAGVGIVLNNYFATIIRALGSNQELIRLATWAWGSLAVAIACIIVGSRWGLVGIVYGAAIGWYVNSVAALFLATSHLRLARGEETTSY